MRTNIVIDDNLMKMAKRASRLPTKKAVVEEALRLLVQTHRQEQILSLRGRVKWKGNLSEMRKGRVFNADGH